MKSATGLFIQPVHDAATAGLPQWARVAQALRHAVASGAVMQGERLPSARQLAKDWRVSRGAVDDAFAELQLEGLIERRVGDGSYLRQGLAEPAPRRKAAPEAQRILQSSLLQGCPTSQLESATRPLRVPPLHPRSVDLDAFPLAAWNRLLLQAHGQGHFELLQGAPAGGLPALREAIARHLAVHRGVQCSPQQVLVTNGPGEGMQLVGRLLLQPGETVWIEHPSHASLPYLMRSLGLQVQGVPLDAQGLDVAAGERLAPRARLCYLHPFTQYPLGVSTSAARCQALLDWALRSDAWIVEGHMNDELVPPAQQPPTLMSRDRVGRTLMLGTFEGVAFPSLRVGYLVLPPALAEAFVAAAQAWGEHVSPPVQWALAAFIDRGHMTTHLQAQRQRRAAKRALIQRLLLPALPPGVHAGPLHSGMHLCLHLPPDWDDTQVAARLRAQRLYVEPLSLLAWEQQGLNGIVLGYAGLNGAALEQALQTLAQTLSTTPRG